eukprot:8855578-Pyramimonas_sp.AAC.1
MPTARFATPPSRSSPLSSATSVDEALIVHGPEASKVQAAHDRKVHAPTWAGAPRPWLRRSARAPPLTLVGAPTL